MMGAQCFTDLKLRIMGLRYHLCAISVPITAVPVTAARAHTHDFWLKRCRSAKLIANPSDLKHVAELLRCSDGLDVVMTVRLYHLCVF